MDITNNQPIMAYAVKRRDTENYIMLETGIGKDHWIPVFESVAGEKKLRAHYVAFSDELDGGLEYLLVNIRPLVLAKLIPENKLHNFG